MKLNHKEAIVSLQKWANYNLKAVLSKQGNWCWFAGFTSGWRELLQRWAASRNIGALVRHLHCMRTVTYAAIGITRVSGFLPSPIVNLAHRRLKARIGAIVFRG